VNCGSEPQEEKVRCAAAQERGPCRERAKDEDEEENNEHYRELLCWRGDCWSSWVLVLLLFLLLWWLLKFSNRRVRVPPA